MKNIHILCLLLLVYNECTRIYSTTVNLVSVLRKNLMKNNEDFEGSVEIPLISPKPTHYAHNVVPAYPPRRSEYLQPNKLLEVNGDPTGFEGEPYTFEMNQPIETETQTSSSLTVEMNPQIVRASKDAKLQTVTLKSKKPSKITTQLTPASKESNVFDSREIISRMAQSTYQVTYGVADITDKQRLHFNEALRNRIKEKKFISMKNLTPGKNALRLLTMETKIIPDFTGSKFEDIMAHIATKDWAFNSKAPPLLVQTTKLTTKSIIPSDDEQGSGDEREPDHHQLDMAPAKGDLIHAQRQRNRVCNRNVLVPEGPKYSELGQATKAPTTVKDQDFSQTKGPKYILPRCCNCCKKSVLGCD